MLYTLSTYGDVLTYVLYTCKMLYMYLISVADVYQGLARAGRGAGVRSGEWMLRLVESGDLTEEGWLKLDGLREVGVVQGARTEKHLLRPYDVLVTARSGSQSAALVPPEVSRTVASVTLLVVRPRQPELGMGHWLWYFLTSSYGRAQIQKRLTVSSTVTSLSAGSLGEIEVPVPSQRGLSHVSRLVEASESAYNATVEAARLRRETLRDALVHDLAYGPQPWP